MILIVRELGTPLKTHHDFLPIAYDKIECHAEDWMGQDTSKYTFLLAGCHLGHRVSPGSGRLAPFAQLPGRGADIYLVSGEEFTRKYVSAN